MKKLKSIILFITIVIITIGFFLLIVALQLKLLPQEYLIWIFKYPANRLVFIYIFYLIFGFFYIFFKNFKEWLATTFKSSKRKLLPIFIIFNIVLFYIVISSVAVITNNKIIDYSFHSPEGREYSYNDVVKINTGVYGKKKLYLPSFFARYSKGDFFYIIELDDGSKIDLTEVGGVKNDEHPYFVIEELDIQFVNMDIPKVSSMENFKYNTEHLDEVYTNKIRNILENTNEK